MNLVEQSRNLLNLIENHRRIANFCTVGDFLNSDSSVDISPVAYFDHDDGEYVILNEVHNSICSLADAISAGVAP